MQTGSLPKFLEFLFCGSGFTLQSLVRLFLTKIHSFGYWEQWKLRSWGREGRGGGGSPNKP